MRMRRHDGRVRRAVLFPLWVGLGVVLVPVFSRHGCGQPSLVVGLAVLVLHYLADPEFDRLHGVAAAVSADSWLGKPSAWGSVGWSRGMEVI